MRRVKLVAVLLMAMSSGVWAVDKDGRQVVYDRAQDSCGQFIEARRFNAQENSVYAIWLAGFLTAYNFLKPDTLDILNTQIPATQILWLARWLGLKDIA